MNKMLLVIDCQYDFINGSLAVSESEKTMEKLSAFIKENGNEYTIAVATVDWHPLTHCSFKDNGGVWPVHCLQFSHGASIHQDVLMSLQEYTKNFVVLTKGCESGHEEYSIFKNAESAEKIKSFVEKFNIDEIDVCGIAFDYCVADSCKDGIAFLPDVSFRVIKELSPAIGDGKEFCDFISNTEKIEIK